MAAFLALLVAFAAGVAIAFQTPLASLMSERIGSLESAFVIHLGGALGAAIPLLMIGGGQLGDWRSVPWYALGAGVLGIVLIVGVSYTIPRIGVAATIAAFVSAQLIVGAVLDHFGVLGVDVRALDPQRMLGIGVIVLGVWLVTR